MRIHLRKQQRTQGAEFIFGLLVLPLLYVALALTLHLPRDVIPPCMGHRLLGIPCPTCGSYRSAQLLMEARVVDACRMQPLATAVVLGGLVFMLYSWLVVGLALPRLRVENAGRCGKWTALAIVVFAVLVNWGYLILAGR